VPPEDFFNEDWEEPSRTQETAVTRPPDDTGRSERPRPPRRDGGDGGGGRRPPRMPRSGAQPQWARLGVLGVGIVVVLVIVYLVANSLFGGGGNATATYFTRLSPALADSDHASTGLQAVLQSRPMSVAQFRSRMNGPIADAEHAYQSAAALSPPKAISRYTPFLVEALRYRVLGLQCISKNAAAAFDQRGVEQAGAELTVCMRLLLASDQLYLNSFYTQAVGTHPNTQVPTSRFLPEADTRLLLAKGMGQTIARLRLSSVHGLHGTELHSVVVEPAGRTLVPGSSIASIKYSQQLRIVVTAIDSGDFEEVNIPVAVTLTLAGQAPITVTRTIHQITPGQAATVAFSALFAKTNNQPTFVRPYTVKVVVHGVPGERNLSNNQASYRVSFVDS
jgi:hypothetical protein